MTHDEDPNDLAETATRVRAAFTAVAQSVEAADLRDGAVVPTGHRHSRRSHLLAVAAVVILLGGTVTALSLTRDAGIVTGLTTSSSPVSGTSSSPVLTVAALPGAAGSAASCAYGGFKDYADDAVRRGDALVTGTLRPTGKAWTIEDGNLGWQSVQVELTVDSVLAGKVRTRTMTARVAAGVVFLDPPPPPSSGAVSTPPDGGAGDGGPILDYEGNGGWATDGAFLGLLRQNTGGENAVLPIPLVDDRAVVGLGCWSSGGLPTVRERVELVLSATPPVTISAPVDLVAVQDIRDSLR